MNVNGHKERVELSVKHDDSNSDSDDNDDAAGNDDGVGCTICAFIYI